MRALNNCCSLPWSNAKHATSVSSLLFIAENLGDRQSREEGDAPQQKAAATAHGLNACSAERHSESCTAVVNTQRYRRNKSVTSCTETHPEQRFHSFHLISKRLRQSIVTGQRIDSKVVCQTRPMTQMFLILCATVVNAPSHHCKVYRRLVIKVS